MTELWAEIGINHQGSLLTALEMAEKARDAGADLVKFQIRTPRLAVPKDQWNKPKTWQGKEMTYLEYKECVELSREDYKIIDEHCPLPWSASVWDIPSLEFLNQFEVPWIKIPSAKLTDSELVEATAATGRRVVLSTGMSTMLEISEAVRIIQHTSTVEPLLMHCNSSYPALDEEQDLDVIRTLNHTFLIPVGFSSHSKSPYPALYAAARYDVPAVEVHFTLDRAMEGTDHASSLESDGLELLAREFRRIPLVVGSKVKQVYDSELPSRLKLRGY
jgi:N-acetylneuraminate synthase